VKGGLAPLDFEPAMIAAIIVDPKGQERRRDYETVQDRGCGEIEHRPEQIPSPPMAATKKRAGADSGAL
jgi:hypothetical protein